MNPRPGEGKPGRDQAGDHLRLGSGTRTLTRLTVGIDLMTDSNANPPQHPATTAPSARPDSGPTRTDTDEAIDAALAKATGRTAGEPRTAEVPLKRQWDAEMEAELEAALSGFDPKSFELASPRAP